MQRHFTRSFGWLACLILATGCSGPFAVFPGGALDGPVVATPESFAFAPASGTIQLETNPAEPYSVNIASAAVGPKLYISAGNSKATWVEHMESDPRVRLRIDGQIYELLASRVTDADELDAFAEEWTKNAWARDPRELDGEVWIYRLDPR